ncbi:lactosylceramide 1,3-N-acetyl-beta-D-glucosaminyltransferase-like [Anthonomus grandis grandis]|uniref:lactosylceramide 1,3-N-acetyl-beta-D-glucosaminyltransferase-like n=1 Tax=Anthonomus grandis grandis TaxID=2921223 RepID=UPI0021667906|nr:lactosylceramide 1,3-N-acetyl-beta-D-glucosaminyltransferase-like [Anthonomus grandis grandis]
MNLYVKLFLLIVTFGIFYQTVFYFRHSGTIEPKITVGEQLVNLTDFQYVIKKDHLCDRGDLLLLVIISSAPKHVKKRQTIRDTWGRKRDHIKFLFNLGLSDQRTNAAIKLEDFRHQDIIQGNFLDSYKNLTYKSTLAVKYASEQCNSAKFILKCDDDVFVNTPQLMNFLKVDLAPTRPENTIFCLINDKMPVIRDPNEDNSKWYVPYEEFREEVYPRYCSGMFVLMTPDVAFNLHKHAQKTAFFWIDDVFLTGLVAKRIDHLRYVDMEGFTLVNVDIDAMLKKEDKDLTFLFGGFNMSRRQIRLLWRYVRAFNERRFS